MESAIQFVERRVKELQTVSLPDAISVVEGMRDEIRRDYTMREPCEEDKSILKIITHQITALEMVLDRLRALSPGVVGGTEDVDRIELVLARKVAQQARQFCEEVSEDSEDIPQVQLRWLNDALDAYEGLPPREAFDDSRLVLASLSSLVSDPHATDNQRRIARLALSRLTAPCGLVELERTELARAIAESDITDGLLENADIDALVDLFESWLERRAATEQFTGGEK
jgi:hypothetical protein